MLGDALNEQAYRIIKNDLFLYEKGKYLSIRQYAKKLGMSPTPVREAFLKLNRDGVLEQVPGVGFFVASMNTNDIIEYFQIRECIEIFALCKSWPLISEEHIEMLDNYIKAQSNYLREDNVINYFQSDEKFHMLFFDLVDNKYLKNIYKNLRERFMICSNITSSMRNELIINEHKDFVKYIKDRDLEGATKSLQKHLEASKTRMRDGFITVYE